MTPDLIAQLRELTAGPGSDMSAVLDCVEGGDDLDDQINVDSDRAGVVRGWAAVYGSDLPEVDRVYVAVFVRPGERGRGVGRRLAAMALALCEGREVAVADVPLFRHLLPEAREVQARGYKMLVRSPGGA